MRIRYSGLLLFFAICFSQLANGQDSLPHCGFGPVRARLGLSDHPQFKTNNPTTDEGQTFIIPVVVHIIYNTTAGNLADYLAQSQIDVLNEDYGFYGRGFNTFPIGGDPTIKPSGGDAHIRFSLATIDPNGNPTTGVDHVKSTYADVNSNQEMLTKDLSVWDVKRYMNIWVVKSIDGSATEQGYAYLSSDISFLPDKNADGIIVTSAFFGRNNPAEPANYKYGRTVTHESGHYFNLLHPWGGDGPGEGGCNDDDDVDDTPDCDQPYYSMYKPIPDSCDDPTQCGYLRLVADYMDYSVDRCMDIFTKGQITRMRQAILKDRPSLVTYENAIATGLQSLYLQYNAPPAMDALDILPNPSNGILYLFPNFVQTETGDLYVYDEIGRLVRHVTVSNMKTDKISIDMYWASNGVYNLILVTPGQTYKQKIVLQH